MATRKSGKKQQPKSLAKSVQEVSSLVPRGTEKTMVDLMRILNEQNFETVAEANDFMKKLMASGGQIPNPLPVSALEQAQDIMYRAFESRNPTERVHLAQEALNLSRDCADAYILLAEENTPTLQAQKTLFEAGVKAGERALGPQKFEEFKGHFWGVLETRPYMRARCGLAGCLRALGENDLAIEHLNALLQLNPNDNQGIRYLLVPLLFDVGDDEALENLFIAYEEEYSATWKYTNALLVFKRTGNSPEANLMLQDALAYNPFVPAYLLGKKRIPKTLPPYMGVGDNNEAIHYSVDARQNWHKTKGALEWLKAALATNTKTD